MGIVFFCQSCGKRFDVEARMAGKRGRCKGCGQQMAIPQAAELASMVAMPALAAAAVGAPQKGGAAPSLSSWLGGMTSNVGMAPLTIDRMPAGWKRPIKPSPLDDAEDSKPYNLIDPVTGRYTTPTSKPANGLQMLWRREFGVVQRVFRGLNETAYMVSVPFLMILLLGAVMRNRPLALMGATVVIGLNLARIIAGLANLLVIPFRDGPITGALFLFPPYTIYYLSTRWYKLRRPTLRVVEPVLTIAAVILAFTFIPWLARGGSSKGSLADQLKSGASAFGQDVRSELEKAKGADLERLGRQAQEKLNEVGAKVHEAVKQDPSLAGPSDPTDGQPSPPPKQP